MKHTLNLILCFLFAFAWGYTAQAQAGIDFGILDMLVDNNDDTRDPPGGLGGSGGSGGGGSNVKIFTDWPNTSKMISKPSRISWSSKGVEGPYTVSIKDSNGTVVHSVETKAEYYIGTFLEIKSR